MPADPESPTPLNHVFVDFENVHEIDRSLIGAGNLLFTLFIGAKQTKLDTTLVEALMAHASSVQLVRVTTSGKNALDLVLASYVGRAVLANPSAHFHIVSKDKDYDALVTHLRERRIAIQRHADWTALGKGSKAPHPAVKAPTKAKSEKQDAYEKLVANLQNLEARPKTKKRLSGLMKGFLEKDASEEAKEKVFERLQDDGHLVCDDKGKITYHFADEDLPF